MQRTCRKEAIPWSNQDVQTQNAELLKDYGQDVEGRLEREILDVACGEDSRSAPDIGLNTVI